MCVDHSLIIDPVAKLHYMMTIHNLISGGAAPKRGKDEVSGNFQTQDDPKKVT
jgi:hypothetical protein